MKAVLYYIHDPMCSWCWGFASTLKKLMSHLPPDLQVVRLLGGLAADTNEPMPDYLKKTVQSSWKRIEETIPGMKFNFDFWEKNIPRRSTYPACRAVIAARKQGTEFDDLMTQQIQQAYYRDAMNPSDKSVLIALADSLKLNRQQFISDLESEKMNNELMSEIEQARDMFVESYPALVLDCDDEFYTIPIDYISYKNMLAEINTILHGNNAQ